MRPTASGKDAIRAVWQEYFATPGFVVTCHPVKIQASRSGVIGYTQGPYDLAFAAAKGNAIKDRGKYLAVWKKQTDGAWRVVADIFNSYLPQVAVRQNRDSINAPATQPVPRIQVSPTPARTPRHILVYATLFPSPSS